MDDQIMAQQRGRQGGAALGLAANNTTADDKVTVLRQRPKPPKHFPRGSAEHQLWVDIVDSQVVDWFQPGDLPVLDAYVRTVVQHRRVSQQIVDTNAEFTMVGAQGGVIANPIYGVQAKLAGTMAQLAQKLRLTQSARYNGQKAATLGRRGAREAGSRPWQQNDD